MLLLLHLQRVELDYVFKAKKVNALVRSEIRGLESAREPGEVVVVVRESSDEQWA
jgi:hypothetical protein